MMDLGINGKVASSLGPVRALAPRSRFALRKKAAKSSWWRGETTLSRKLPQS